MTTPRSAAISTWWKSAMHVLWRCEEIHTRSLRQRGRSDQRERKQQRRCCACGGGDTKWDLETVFSVKEMDRPPMVPTHTTERGSFSPDNRQTPQSLRPGDCPTLRRSLRVSRSGRSIDRWHYGLGSFCYVIHIFLNFVLLRTARVNLVCRRGGRRVFRLDEKRREIWPNSTHIHRISLSLPPTGSRTGTANGCRMCHPRRRAHWEGTISAPPIKNNEGS